MFLILYITYIVNIRYILVFIHFVRSFRESICFYVHSCIVSKSYLLTILTHCFFSSVTCWTTEHTSFVRGFEIHVNHIPDTAPAHPLESHNILTRYIGYRSHIFVHPNALPIDEPAYFVLLWGEKSVGNIRQRWNATELYTLFYATTMVKLA